MTQEGYDYIVVGGGSAGCVVASRLAEAAEVSVCLIEAGPNDRDLAEVQDLARWSQLLHGELDFGYRIEPQIRGNSRLVHSRGRVLGGCSSHNSCIALRPSAADFESWERRGAEGWGPDAVGESFERVVQRVHLELGNTANPLTRDFVASAGKAGHPLTDFSQPFFSQPWEGGAGWLPLNKRGTRRESSSNAYLHRPGVANNLTIKTMSPVVAISWLGRRAKAVVLANGSEIHVGRDLVLSAGAFDTPKLLLLSGVGPPDELEALGIAVQHPLTGVGKHLIDHPEGVVIWELDRALPGATSQKYEAALFADVDGDGRADVMLHFGLEAFDMHTAPAGYPSASDAFSLTPNVCYALSEGDVALRSGDPGDPVVIDPRYFSDSEGYDERIMLEGFRIARKVVAQTPLADWALRELAPGADVVSDADLSGYLRRTHNTVYHPAGTCRMGALTDETTVVDPNLRLVGIDNVFIADASVFPEMVGVNPNLTVMMIGERCAALIAPDR